MKKVFTGIISAGAVSLLGLLCVSAADFSGQKETAGIQARDGSCVARTEASPAVCACDADGDGTCDRKADSSAACVYDADGDGTCDRREICGGTQNGFGGSAGAAGQVPGCDLSPLL